MATTACITESDQNFKTNSVWNYKMIKFCEMNLNFSNIHNWQKINIYCTLLMFDLENLVLRRARFLCKIIQSAQHIFGPTIRITNLKVLELKLWLENNVITLIKCSCICNAWTVWNTGSHNFPRLFFCLFLNVLNTCV